MNKVYDDKRKMFVPASMAIYAAGPDSYLKEKYVVCSSCKIEYQLKGAEDSEVCNDCYDDQGMENHFSDTGHNGTTEYCEFCKK